MISKRLPKPGLEVSVALIGTIFSAFLLYLAATHAGPLWRDEVNTFNMAQMPSLKDLWDNLPFESFPPLWPLVLRVCGFLGLTGSDLDVRMLGLCVGLCFFGSLWLCSRWIGARAPILSIGLLGCLPAFLFVVGENRAYGLASCLMLLSFGTIWRMMQNPSKSRIFWAGLFCLLFTQCVYFDVVFLCAMLAGGAIVALRRQQWRTLWALVGIGFVSGASMAIYVPVIHRGSAYLPLIREPFFDPATVWFGFCKTLAAQSSASAAGVSGLRAWLPVDIWFELLLVGSVVALIMHRTRGRKEQVGNPEPNPAQVRNDRALFCAVSMVVGIAGCFAFLLKLHSFMQPWYYIELLCLCAISLEGILNANWPTFRPWGMLRIGLVAVIMIVSTRSAWEEAHTRRSNMDLTADYLSQKAAPGDFIVVEDAWEGITFARYYHGQTHWMTVPPIDSHKVHRNDLIVEKMNQRDSMLPVLQEIIRTLRRGNNVWLVGSSPVVNTKQSLLRAASSPPPPPALPMGWWLGYYFDLWNQQVAAVLLDEALQKQAQKIPVNESVSHYEDVSVVRFSGYKSGEN